MKLPRLKKIWLLPLAATLAGPWPAAAQGTPPTLTQIDPTPGGNLLELSQINVTFSESVTGVDASDLLIDGVPASTILTNDPNNYTFFFTQPAVGPVQVAWVANHGITDTQANPFAGGSWSYTLDTNILTHVVISEFLANNTVGIRDEDGTHSDWLELFNRGTIQASLGGWFLTDNPTNLTKWQFPAGMPALQPNNYLLVWASGKDRTNALAPLHTNFKLSSTAGSYLALVDPNTNVFSAFDSYPAQQADVSYGRDTVDPSLVGYFTVPTPGKQNSTSGSGFATEPVFSVDTGIYTNATLTLTLSAPAGTIRYTLDASVPTNNSPVYTGALTLSNNVVVKARAFPPAGTNLWPSRVIAKSYIFLDGTDSDFNSNLPLLIISLGQIIPQNVPPGGTRPEGSLAVIDTSFGRSSIRSTPDFQGIAGFEIYGQTSAGFPKPPVRIEIHNELGNDLNVPLLGLPADNDWKLRNPFDDKTLLNDFLGYELFEQMGHYSCRRRFVETFIHTGGGRLRYPDDYVGVEVLFETIKVGKNRVNIPNLTPYDTTEPAISGGWIFKKDKDSAGDLNFSTAGGNGFPAEALKVHEPKPNTLRTVPVTGPLTPSGSNQLNWLVAYLNQLEKSLYATNWLSLTGTNHYSNYLDVDSFIDFHWVVEFTKQIDGIRLSDYFTKDRNGKVMAGPVWDWNLAFGNANYLRGGQTDGWYYAEQDQGITANEQIWLRRLINGSPNMGAGNTPGPGGDPDFNQKIADRWSVLRTNVLSGTRVLQRIDELSTLLSEAAARDLWGKWASQIVGVYQWPNPDGTADGRDVDFVHPTKYLGNDANSIIWQMKKWMWGRYLWIDSQFTPVPIFSASDGQVTNGFAVTIVPPPGATLYYTLDGTDPRASGGATLPGAFTNNGPTTLTITSNVRIVARARNTNSWYNTWSGPVAVTLFTSLPPLRITEIMYSPLPPPAGSPYTAQDFEYVELQNTGVSPLFLGGIQFINGIQFTFDANIYVPTGAATAQTFDGGGTPYSAATLGPPPSPTVTAGGPAANFMRLIPSGGNTSRNRIAFDETAPGPHDRILADFDFRGIDLGGATSTGTPTLQNFDVPGATYTLSNYLGAVLAAVRTNTAPTNRFMQLTTKTTNDWNAIVFDNTATGVFNTVVANFDFRITPTSEAISQGLGMGFALLNTATYGTTGAASVPAFAEEPNLPNSLGVGLDIFQNATNSPAEPNNNHVSLHYNGAQVSPIAAIPTFDLSNGQFHRAQVMVRFVGGNALVSVRITPNILGTPGPTEILFDNFVIRGVAPYAGRPAFGAHTGLPSASHDLDNVDVEYMNLPAPGGLSFLLLPKSTFGMTGAGTSLSDFMDEPALPGAFAVDLVMHPVSLINNVAAYWNSNRIVNVSVPPASVSLAAGVFHHAHLQLDSSPGGATVNLTLTPDIFGALGAPVMALNNLFVPGLSPGDVRVEFAGRAGELNLSVDLDNLNVQYQQLIPNTLGPGQSLVLVKNIAAFQSRYGTAIRIGGQYSGALNNGGETLAVVGALDEPILNFTYDNAWYPTTDGYGFSLSILNPNAPVNTWGDPASWRPSSTLGGSPGLPNPPPIDFPPIVVNEVLANSIPPSKDTIELYNPSASAANLGGWFLTDNPSKPAKYRIPDGTIIGAGGYLVFDETEFNPTPGVGTSFAFSRNGDQAYIFSGDASGNLSGYIQGVQFGASDNGVSFGRFTLSTGEADFTAQISNTFGAANAGPSVGPVVINEIMYHPPDLFLNDAFWDDTQTEYVELYNLIGSPVALFDPAFPTNTWKLDGGIQFQFPPGVTLPPHGFLLAVNFDPVADPLHLAAFQNRYGLSASVPIFGPYGGKLGNTSDDLQLFKPRGPDAGLIPQVLVDRVKYHNAAPWPLAADGIGPALQRINSAAYGNEPTNWVAARPTPGAPFGGGAPPIVNTQPLPQTAVQYQSASFTVVAGGNGPFSYQWRFNGNNVPGATNATLTLNNVQPSDAGDYIAVIMNPANSVSSAPARLTVLKVPAIISQPANISIAPSNNVTFAVVAASDHPPVTYQWRLNGANLPGQTSNTLTIPNVQLPLNGNAYDVVVTDQIGSVTSSKAILTVLVKPIFLLQPQSQTALVGDTVTFSVAVTGTPPFGYRWIYKTTNGLTRQLAPFGLGMPTVTVTNVQLNNAGTYTAAVTNVATLPTLPISSAGAFLTVLVDSDGDRMPDVWEMAYFGTLARDGSGDFDGDGMTDLQEYIAGTDPTDPASYLKIDTISGAPSATTLQFTAVSNKTYSLQFKDSLTAGVWTKFKDVPASTNTHEVTVLDPNSPANSRFYRLVTPRLPDAPNPGPAF